MASSSSPDHLHSVKTLLLPCSRMERRGGGVPGGAFCPVPRRSPVKCWTPLIFGTRSLGRYRFNSRVPPQPAKCRRWVPAGRLWYAGVQRGGGISKGRQEGKHTVSTHMCLQTLKVLHQCSPKPGTSGTRRLAAAQVH